MSLHIRQIKTITKNWPIKTFWCGDIVTPVAELVNALDLGSKVWGFKSPSGYRISPLGGIGRRARLKI
jgi:hypothetical protein